MPWGKEGRAENHAIDLVIAEQVEIRELLLDIVFRICEEHTVAMLFEHLGNARGDTPDGFRVNFGEDYADNAVFPCAEYLRIAGRGVAGLFDHFTDAGLFLLADVAVVEVAGNAGFGYPGAPGNLSNGHSRTAPSCQASCISFIVADSRTDYNG